MLCRMCFQAQATFHVLDRPADDGLAESHYCAACYESLYVHPLTGSIAVADDPPPADPPAFPWLRFTIRDQMILAAGFAIINAVLVLFMRSVLVGGPAAQIQAWTLRALLVANPCFAVFLAEFTLFVWIRKLHWHKLTGGLPVPDRKAVPRHVMSRIAWEGASPLERVFFLLCLWWPLMWPFWFLLLIESRVWSFIAARNEPLVFAAAACSVLVGIQILLFWGLVASTRRR